MLVGMSHACNRKCWSQDASPTSQTHRSFSPLSGAGRSQSTRMYPDSRWLECTTSASSSKIDSSTPLAGNATETGNCLIPRCSSISGRRTTGQTQLECMLQFLWQSVGNCCTNIKDHQSHSKSISCHRLQKFQRSGSKHLETLHNMVDVLYVEVNSSYHGE